MRTYRSIPSLTPRQLANFWAKVAVPDQPSCCWEWTAAKTREGYGLFGINGSTHSAHRIAYTVLIGPIPEGLTIDHLCRNRGCVNADHLQPVDFKTNCRRGYGAHMVNSRKTHCLNGHPFDEQNTYVNSGRRFCRTCMDSRRDATRQFQAVAVMEQRQEALRLYLVENGYVTPEESAGAVEQYRHLL